jgi:pimeloyl-ACP methyl ester carboxylesterase
MTEIDGLDIHFIHARSPHDDALPLIITHGWPGSIIEMLNVIGPLTDPTAHGGRREDAFHVVIPSMPGYGFSGKPDRTGWDVPHIARAWAELMKRLGYTHYVAQGGDWGALITEVMGAQAPEGLLGIHTNMPGALPPTISKVIASNVLGAGDPAPTTLSDEEQRAYDRLSFFYTKGIGYALEMGNRPQTLYGLADSPVALAAWMIDHDAWSLEDIQRAFVEERPVGNLTRDEVLDNVTLYWLTNTGSPLPVSTGRTSSASWTARTSRSRRPSASSRTSSTRPRGLGPSRRFRTSFTSTRSTRVTTSPPGRSQTSSRTRCGPGSGRCIR